MLKSPTPLTLLYTALLAGRLDLLPRLFTRIKQARAESGVPCLLVDLGCACMPGTWICETTSGRGMLVAMDGMGYDAFHIGPRDPLYTRPDLVEQLQRVVATPFAAGPWTTSLSRSGVAVRLVNALNLNRLPPEQTVGVDLIVGLRLLSEAAPTRVQAAWRDPFRVLMVDGGMLGVGPLFGRIDIVIGPDAPYIEVVRQMALTVPDDLMPDPGMSSVIEFVESEARYAERRRGQSV